MQPFAFDSREFLRKLLIGKEVEVAVESSGPNGREFCQVKINGDDVARLILSEGLAKMRETSKQQELCDAQNEAQKSKKGIWGIDSHPIITKDHSSIPDLNQFYLSRKGLKLDGIIEYVRDCTSFKILLLNEHQIISLHLSGIKGPLSTDPIYEESKFFVESRLLQRNVAVIIEGVSQNSLLGTVIHPAGNITEILLKEGFVQVSDYSASSCHLGLAALRTAESFAKERRLRLWKNFVPIIRESSKEFFGTVSRIVNGESIIIQLSSGEEKRICFSSIRQAK